MSRNNTGNPIDSKAYADFEDNVKNLDEAVNTADPQWVDRLGRFRLPLMEQERQFVSDQERREGEFQADQADRESEFRTFIASSGYQFAGDYAAGIEITQYNQLVRDENGEFWRVSGQVDLPYVTTGAGVPEDDALVPAGDAVLRQSLAATNGTDLIGHGDDSLTQFLDVGVKNPSYLRVNKPTRSAIGVASRGGFRADSSPARPLVSFIDDDARPAVYSYLFPILKAKNIPFGLAIPSNTLGKTNKITLAQLREIAAGSDVEILSHGYDELYLNTLTDEEQEHELRASKEQLESYGFHVNLFVPVGGVMTANSRPIIDRYYAGLFNAGSDVDRDNTVANLNETDIYRVNFGVASSIQKYKDDVDRAIDRNSWLVFMTHVNVQDANHNAWLPELIDYIKSRGVEIVKPSDGLAEFGQVFRQGIFSGDSYFAVRKDGTVRSSDIEAKYYDYDDSRPFNAGLNEYPRKRAVVAVYSEPGLGAPTGNSGTLITHRPAQPLAYTNWGWQVWRGNSSSKTEWVREWIQTDPEGDGYWGDWEISGQSIITRHKQLITFGSIAAQSTNNEDIAIPGTSPGHSITVNSRQAMPSGVILSANCFAAGVVTVSATNVRGESVNVPGRDIDLRIERIRI